MGKVDEYREKLRDLDSWDSYLLDESRLPGPRANLELAFAVAFEGSEEQFLRFARIGPDDGPQNTKEEFLAFCGVLGLGYLAARCNREHFEFLRKQAADPRWRIREAVALGLQKYGETAFGSLLALMDDWSTGSLLERRAVVATLCEPGLLKSLRNAEKIIDMLDRVTSSILSEEDRRSEEFRVLRKALGYGWSVAVSAHPDIGKPLMERWINSEDKDIRWIMSSNLKKNRLSKFDPVWVKSQLEAIGSK